MSLVKKPVFWVSIIGLSIAAYVMTEPSNTASGEGIKAVTKRKAASSKSKSLQFTKEDFSANFTPTTIPVKNSFVPVVARKTSGSNADSIAPNVVPTDFTGGEAGWVYTGNAEIDGRAVALLENRSTGDGIFLRRGESWKKCRVVSIGSDSVVLRGPDFTQTFSLVDESMTTSPNVATRLSPMGVQVPNDFRGRIGGNNFGGGQPNMMSGGMQMNPQGGGQPMVQLPQVMPDNVIIETP